MAPRDGADRRRALGRQGEGWAVAYLERRGFEIVARNLRVRRIELDLIAREGDVLCFIEVKLRTTKTFGSPEEAVDLRKQRRIVRAATELLVAERGDRRRLPRCRRVRFDVIAIDAAITPPRIRHLRDAFRADGS